MNKLITLTGIILITSVSIIQAQKLTQSIRGNVKDLDSKTPLTGVTLYMEGTNPVVGTITDENGNFAFKELPIGRYNIVVNYLGYESKIIPNVLSGAGKEVYLNVELLESVEVLEEIVVKAKKNKGEPLNEMASVSARSFSVEETQRFAGSFNDPSRMASSYAGVMSNPDGDNDIIIRGNSPRGMLWRVEGIPIPNTNHFANEGATGGPISILNSTTLSNSDFFTGAFPAEYGNAFSGVFDIHLRKGNDQKREFTVQAGILGTDISAEGPFMKDHSASYLFNYRYSSLELMNNIGIKIVGDAVPKFQDMTLNVNIPTKRYGTFQVIGIGGLSGITFEEEDFSEQFDANLGVLGLNHIYPISTNTYLKSSVSYVGTSNIWDYYEMDDEINRMEFRGKDRVYYSTYRGATSLTHKFSAKNTVKTGVSVSAVSYNLYMDNYDEDLEILYNIIDEDGSSELVEAYANWKFRPVESLTFNSGIHYLYLNLNGNYSIEPRVGMRWQFTGRQAISAGFGMHSKSEVISIYLGKELLDDGTTISHNKDLGFIKSRHYVIGYENRISKNLHVKIESYYQDLYNVPVSDDPEDPFSIVNQSSSYLYEKMVNEGTGENYGIELSLEKFLSKNYYFLFTSSLFNSKYVAQDGRKYDTKYNNNYIFNLTGGKEFPVGKRRINTIGLNVRASYAGGRWYTPIDITESQEKGYTCRDNSQAYSKQREDFMRYDLKLNFRRNKKKTTRVWELDIQNVTNAANIIGDYWDDDDQEVVEYYQLGILPTINYRIEF